MAAALFPHGRAAAISTSRVPLYRFCVLGGGFMCVFCGKLGVSWVPIKAYFGGSWRLHVSMWRYSGGFCWLICRVLAAPAYSQRLHIVFSAKSKIHFGLTSLYGRRVGLKGTLPQLEICPPLHAYLSSCLPWLLHHPSKL